MKKIVLLLLFLAPLFSFSQDSEGQIIFKETMRMDFSKREDVSDHFKEMMKDMPKESSIQKQLLFTTAHSFYGPYEDPDAPAASLEEVRGPMRWMMMRADEETYVNYTEKRLAQQKETFGRTFLIRDSLEKVEWKMTPLSKEILGYTCMKATTMRDSSLIEAWFTPQIPVFGGPEATSSLPGMILEVSMRDGMFSITAEKIEFRKIKKKEIREPEKGKVVTREEYKEIVRAKREEMREMRGKGGHGGPGGHGHGH